MGDRVGEIFFERLRFEMKHEMRHGINQLGGGVGG